MYEQTGVQAKLEWADYGTEGVAGVLLANTELAKACTLTTAQDVFALTADCGTTPVAAFAEDVSSVVRCIVPGTRPDF